MPTAILVDGGFFLKRYTTLIGKNKPNKVAEDLHRMCLDYLSHQAKREDNSRKQRPRRLYRIFYYDCQPLQKKTHHPITGRSIDFSRTSTAKWRFEFLRELKAKRKVALRLGYLNEDGGYWVLERDRLKRLVSGALGVQELGEYDVRYDVRQKGVDMRLGLDVASMAYKKQVNQIILVAGDSDFVPAAKLARREGIDFILDPMWANIRPDLHEHIDGLRSVLPRPKKR